MKMNEVFFFLARQCNRRPYVTIFWTEQLVFLSGLCVHLIRSHVTIICGDVSRQCLQKPQHVEEDDLEEITRHSVSETGREEFEIVLGAFEELRKPTISFIVCLAARPSLRLSAWNSSAPTGRIFMNFGI